MAKMLPYILLYLLSVFLSSISQIALKKEAMKEHDSVLKEYLNPAVIISYLVFGGCTLLTLQAYKGLPMNYGSVLETAGYFFVTVLGALFLGEKVTFKKMTALAVIFLGIMIYAL